MEYYCHLHFAERETEARSLLKVTEVGWTLTPRQSALLIPRELQRLKLLVSPLQLLSLPSAHCLLDSGLLQILPTKMFSFGFLISLNFSRLEGPGSLNSNKHFWRSECSPPPLLPTLLPLCFTFLSLFPLLSPSVSSSPSYRA